MKLLLNQSKNKSDDKNKQQLKEKYTESYRLMRGTYLFDYEYIFELHTEELVLVGCDVFTRYSGRVFIGVLVEVSNVNYL